MAHLSTINPDGSPQVTVIWIGLACELQRDWARTDTVADVVDIVLTSRLSKGL